MLVSFSQTLSPACSHRLLVSWLGTDPSLQRDPSPALARGWVVGDLAGTVGRALGLQSLPCSLFTL